MNRRKFFKGIGAVVTTTIVAPHVILAETPPVAETLVGGEGLWVQLKRAKLVKYGSPNGLTREHIKEAVEYVFRNHKPVKDRMVTIKTDKRTMKIMGGYMLNGITHTT